MTFPTNLNELGALIAAHKGIVAIIGLGLLLVVVAMYMTDCGSNWNFRRGINKDLTNVNALKQKQADINANIANLKIQEAETNVEVKQAEANHAQDQQVTNESLNNLNIVNARDYNGTSTDAANSARCKAYPDSPECRR